MVVKSGNGEVDDDDLTHTHTHTHTYTHTHSYIYVCVWALLSTSQSTTLYPASYPFITTAPDTSYQMTKMSEFPRIYEEPYEQSKKEILATFYDQIKGNSITEETLKCGATYDLLGYNNEEDFFLASYLPEIDSDDLEFGKPVYIKLAASSNCHLKPFLKKIIDMTTLKQQDIRVTLKKLLVQKYLKSIRVLWNGNKFVLSYISDLVNVSTYERNINK